MRWFKELTPAEQLETICEMYYSYGTTGNEEILKEVVEMKSIFLKGLKYGE